MFPQALPPKPPRPEQAALPEERWGLPSCPSVAKPPLLGSRHGAHRQPLSTARRHLPRSSAHLRDQAQRVMPCQEQGNSALPEIPPDHTSSSAARLPVGTALPHTPHNPEEERTPAACAVLQDVRRYSQRVSKSKNNCSVSKSTVRRS